MRWLALAGVAVVLVGSCWLAARRCADPEAPLLGRCVVGGMLGLPATIALIAATAGLAVWVS